MRSGRLLSVRLGYAHERGEGAGLGTNFNIRCRSHGDDGYLQALAWRKNDRGFAPGALVSHSASMRRSISVRVSL